MVSAKVRECELLDDTSAQLGYTVPFTLDVLEKYKMNIIYYKINNK